MKNRPLSTDEGKLMTEPTIDIVTKDEVLRGIENHIRDKGARKIAGLIRDNGIDVL